MKRISLEHLNNDLLKTSQSLNDAKNALDKNPDSKWLPKLVTIWETTYNKLLHKIENYNNK